MLFTSREANFASYKAHIEGLQQDAVIANVLSPSPPPRQRRSHSRVRTLHGQPVIDVDSISSDIVSTGEAGLEEGTGLNAEDNETLDRILNDTDSSSEHDETPSDNVTNEAPTPSTANNTTSDSPPEMPTPTTTNYTPPSNTTNDTTTTTTNSNATSSIPSVI